MDAPSPSAPTGREANAVIVFADIVGCSQISDALGLRAYADFIHEFHETAAEAAALVFKPHHYTLNTDYELSIRGDEACVIIHRSPGEDIQRALLFAVTLQLLWLCAEYNRQRLAKRTSPVELGVGVHAGTVYVDKFQHEHPTSEGYAINVAKRIEGLSRDGVASKIMISSQAFAHLAMEHRGLSFPTDEVDMPVAVRGVQGTFFLRELVNIDESLVLDLQMPGESFDETLVEQIKFVAETRADAPWLHVLWRIAYGILHGEDGLFRHLYAQQVEASRNSNSWFLRAQRERESSDYNMAADMFELAASVADGSNASDAKSWAFYNAALAHELRGATKSAIASYQRALRLRPAHAHYQVGLIAGYVKAQRAQDALTFLRDIREEFLEPAQRATRLFLESVCLSVLGEAGSDSCRQILEQHFNIDRADYPKQDDFLKPGADAGDVLLRAFQNLLARKHSR